MQHFEGCLLVTQGYTPTKSFILKNFYVLINLEERNNVI